MGTQSTQPQLSYKPVPELGIEFATEKTLNILGSFISGSQYDAKRWVQERGLFLPTSAEWTRGRDYFEENKLRIEIDMVKWPEYTDDIIAWPNPDTGKYADNINPRPNPGKYPLHIVRWTLGERNEYPIIDGGDRIELPELSIFKGEMYGLPVFGMLVRAIQPLGLAAGDFIASDSQFSYEQGLRAVVRADAGLGPPNSRNTGMMYPPSNRSICTSFRPVRKIV